MKLLLASSIFCVYGAACVNFQDIGPKESDLAPEDRILNGTKADLLEYPFLLAILGTTKDVLCGGSLLLPDWVLTAAHCFFNSNRDRYAEAEMSYTMGHSDIRDTAASHKIQTRRSFKVFLHEEYSWHSMRNDIALVKLCSSFDKEDTVQLASIADRDHSASLEGHTCTVLGWISHPQEVIPKGIISSGTLMKVQMKFIPYDVCKYVTSQMTKNTMCVITGERWVGPCFGDSGGPLICRRTLVGVLSFGFGCGLPMTPTVFTNVGLYRDWILETVLRGNSMNATCCASRWIFRFSLMLSATLIVTCVIFL